MPTLITASYSNHQPDLLTYNDSTLATWQWKHYDSLYGKGTELETVKCVDLIESWTHLTQAERAEFVHELPLPIALCPNMTDFMVSGGTMGRSWLQLTIEPTEAGKAFLGWSSVYQTDITRFFEPSLYKEKGWLEILQSDQSGFDIQVG